MDLRKRNLGTSLKEYVPTELDFSQCTPRGAPTARTEIYVARTPPAHVQSISWWVDLTAPIYIDGLNPDVPEIDKSTDGEDSLEHTSAFQGSPFQISSVEGDGVTSFDDPPSELEAHIDDVTPSSKCVKKVDKNNFSGTGSLGPIDEMAAWLLDDWGSPSGDKDTLPVLLDLLMRPSADVTRLEQDSSSDVVPPSTLQSKIDADYEAECVKYASTSEIADVFPLSSWLTCPDDAAGPSSGSSDNYWDIGDAILSPDSLNGFAHRREDLHLFQQSYVQPIICMEMSPESEKEALQLLTGIDGSSVDWEGLDADSLTAKNISPMTSSISYVAPEKEHSESADGFIVDHAPELVATHISSEKVTFFDKSDSDQTGIRAAISESSVEDSTFVSGHAAATLLMLTSYTTQVSTRESRDVLSSSRQSSRGFGDETLSVNTGSDPGYVGGDEDSQVVSPYQDRNIAESAPTSTQNARYESLGADGTVDDAVLSMLLFGSHGEKSSDASGISGASGGFETNVDDCDIDEVNDLEDAPTDLHDVKIEERRARPPDISPAVLRPFFAVFVQTEELQLHSANDVPERKYFQMSPYLDHLECRALIEREEVARCRHLLAPAVLRSHAFVVDILEESYLPENGASEVFDGTPVEAEEMIAVEEEGSPTVNIASIDPDASSLLNPARIIPSFLSRVQPSVPSSASYDSFDSTGQSLPGANNKVMFDGVSTPSTGSYVSSTRSSPSSTIDDLSSVSSKRSTPSILPPRSVLSPTASPVASSINTAPPEKNAADISNENRPGFETPNAQAGDEIASSTVISLPDVSCDSTEGGGKRVLHEISSSSTRTNSITDFQRSQFSVSPHRRGTSPPIAPPQALVRYASSVQHDRESVNIIKMGNLRFEQTALKHASDLIRDLDATDCTLDGWARDENFSNKQESEIFLETPIRTHGENVSSDRMLFVLPNNEPVLYPDNVLDSPASISARTASGSSSRPSSVPSQEAPVHRNGTYEHALQRSFPHRLRAAGSKYARYPAGISKSGDNETLPSNRTAVDMSNGKDCGASDLTYNSTRSARRPPPPPPVSFDCGASQVVDHYKSYGVSANNFSSADYMAGQAIFRGNTVEGGKEGGNSMRHEIRSPSGLMNDIDKACELIRWTMSAE